MANIFTLENVTDFSEKINIDDLYEKKRQYDLSKLALFNKILNRIHVRIKTTSRQKADEHFCWFLVPEVIIGVPKYDQAGCIAYLMDKLQDNKFNIRYIHPNTLFISSLCFIKNSLICLLFFNLYASVRNSSSNGKSKNISQHRILAEYFICNPF